ncbi:MAG: leucine-rich repeat domain-containing protein [Clostridia bacterium]|nr:leucine-rich repeat domain-containing protein [Clostridia bacterium]
MATSVVCRVCGTRISAREKNCPRCGASLRYEIVYPLCCPVKKNVPACPCQEKEAQSSIGEVTISSGTTKKDAKKVSLLCGLSFRAGDGGYTVTGVGACGAGDIVIPSFFMGEKVVGIAANAFRYCYSLTGVVVPDTVTSVGQGAFAGCANLKKVVLSKRVTEIAEGLFRGCKNLAEVNIPVGVTEIGGDAFLGCYSLPNVNIPGTVKKIGRAAFADCSSLTGVIIPDGVKMIDSEAFRGCTGLVSASIAGSVTTMGVSSFSDCTSLVSVNVPEGVPYVEDKTFYGCVSLKECVMGKNVSKIGTDAFRNCTSLAFVEIPDNVTEICPGAFANCSGLKKLTIGSRVKSVGDGAFADCVGLREIYYGAVVMNDFPEGSNVFRDAGQAGDGINLMIGRKVAEIPAHLFDCSGLVSTPKIRSVGIEYGSRGVGFGRDAFADCAYLDSVYVSDVATWLSSRFVSVGSNPLYCAEKLYVVDSPLTVLSVPDGVSVINNYAFAGCKTLSEINIGRYVRKIGREAFYGCTNLTHMYLDARSLDDLSPENGAFTEAGRGRDGLTLTVGKDVERIPAYLFDSDENPELCANLVNVVFEEEGKCTASGEKAFHGCTSLTGVYIADVASWCRINFERHSSANPLQYAGNLYLEGKLLTELVIPYGVQGLSFAAFYNCRNLTKVTLPGSLKSVGRRAFSDCTSLETLVVSDNLKNVVDSAFAGCSHIKKIFYLGNAVDWHGIFIEPYNESLKPAMIYYYSERRTMRKGNYWHFDENGNPVPW